MTRGAGGALRPLHGPDRAGPPREAGRVARGRGRRARAEVREDPVEDRRRGQERHDPHRTPAPRAAQRIDLEDPAQQLGPPPARFPERERHGLRDLHRRRTFPVRPARAAPNPPGPIGVPPI